MRIAIGGILHETATFIDRRTTLADFERGFGLFRGDEILKRFTAANMCPGCSPKGVRSSLRSGMLSS